MQKNSTYNKIQEILRAASDNKGTLSDLAAKIAKKTTVFIYYKRAADGVVREYICEIGSIRSKIRFCIRMGLIESEDTCGLTDTGRNALRRGKGRFDLQVQQAVIKLLEDNGLPIAKLEGAINKLLLTDSSSLYQYLNIGLSPEIFRTCLFLLSICGAQTNQNILKPYEKKLYLTDAKLQKAKTLLEGGKP